MFLNLPRFIPALSVAYLRNWGGIKSDISVGLKERKMNLSYVWGLVYLMTFDKCFRNIFYHRIGKWKYLISLLAPQHESVIIGTHAKIGYRFLGIHPIGTTINANEIGDNFTISNNTVIGVKNGKKPSFGNNVYIGPNCIVIGGITIGNNVTIGAGTILTKSVPDNCVVIGNPAYILKQDGVRVNKKL
jgi:serine O-acetyltransferase